MHELRFNGLCVCLKVLLFIFGVTSLTPEFLMHLLAVASARGRYKPCYSQSAFDAQSPAGVLNVTI